MQIPKYRLTLLAAFVLFGLATQSCVSYKSQLVVKDEDEKKLEVTSSEAVRQGTNSTFKENRIRPLDLLMVKINAFEGNTEQFLNREFTSQSTFSQNIDHRPASIYYNSYLVSEAGTIELPLLDEMKVSGMTTNELKKMIDEAYKPYLQQVSTTVKLANLRVTVLGEVENPGLVYLYNERTTILDAISLAGDFTDFASRKNVKLIRQLDEKGQKTQSVVINLSRPDFMDTEFYYVRPDDVIYVEPQKAKSFDISARSYGIVLSTISVLAVITGLVIR